MDYQKWFMHSKTIWGAVILTVTNLLPVAATWFGVDIDAATVGELDKAGHAAIDSMMNTVKVFMDFVGVLLVVWGRVTASKALSFLKSSA